MPRRAKRHNVKGEMLTIAEAAEKYDKTVGQVQYLRKTGRLHDIDNKRHRLAGLYDYHGEKLTKREIMEREKLPLHVIDYVIRTYGNYGFSRNKYKRRKGIKYDTPDGPMLTHEAIAFYGVTRSRFYHLHNHNRLNELSMKPRKSGWGRRYDCKGEMLTRSEMALKYNTTMNRVGYLIKTDQLWRIDIPGYLPTPIESRGKVFESVKKCAEHNKCSIGRVNYWVSQGEPDKIGMRTNPMYQQEMEEYTHEKKQKKLLEAANRLKPRWARE